MFTVTLKDKKYDVPFVSGAALRQIQPALEMMNKIKKASKDFDEGKPVDDKLTIAQAYDTFARWFCIFAGNQFTPDEMLEGYPVDRLLFDIQLAMATVLSGTTEVLSDFPTKAARAKPKKTA